MAEEYDIIIVGAGMIGASLACALAPGGARIALLEREAPPDLEPDAPPDLRVSAISLASERLLQRLGAWSRILALRACPYRRLAVWEKLPDPFGAGELASRFNRTEFSARQVGQPHLGHIVENRVVQLALAAQVAAQGNIDLICPARIESASLMSGRPSLRLEGGRTLEAPLVVGADGAQSAVRRWAGIGEYSDAYAQHALVTTVEVEGPQQDITWQAFTPTGPLAFLPLMVVAGRSYASLVWYHQAHRIPELLALDEDAFAATVRETFPRELPPLRRVVARGSFPLVKRHALSYAKPGVVLIGDAAHSINPLAGQGANLGFQDVDSLARILLEARCQGQDWGDLQVLSRYERERRLANQLMMNLMDLFYYSFSNDLKPLKLLRNLGLAAASLAKPLQPAVIAYAMGLDDHPALRALLPPLPAALRQRLSGLAASVHPL